LEISGSLAAEMNCPRDVSGTVPVLTTRIEQVNFVIVHWFRRVSLRLVVDDSAVRSHRRNGVERRLNELVIFLSVSKHLLSSLELIKSMIWLLQFFLKESEVPHDCCTVTSVRVLHALDLNRGFTSFESFDDSVLLNVLVFKMSAQLRVALLHVAAELFLLLHEILDVANHGIVWLNRAADKLQVLQDFSVEVSLVAEEHGRVIFGVPNKVREKDGVTVDVVSAQVQDPSDLVKCSHQQVINGTKLFAHLNVFGEGVHSCLLGGVHLNQLSRSLRLQVTPDLINEIGGADHFETLFFDSLEADVKKGSWVLSEVETDFIAFLGILSHPVEPGDFLCFHLHHLPAFNKLLGSRKVISAIGPHSSLVLGDDTETVGATETRDVLDALIAWSQVL